MKGNNPVALCYAYVICQLCSPLTTTLCFVCLPVYVRACHSLLSQNLIYGVL
jgi:hypothetical protein